MSFESIDPTTAEIIATYPLLGPGDVEDALTRASDTFQTWRRTSFEERAAPLLRAAGQLRERQEELARLMAREMGKPLREGRAEVEKCAWVCEHYAEHAAAYLAPDPIEIGASHSFVAYQPLGLLLAVMPWNFPLWQVFRCAAPALMAGNVVLLKHAPNVPGCALAVEEIFRAAGLPRGAFRSLFVDTDTVGHLLADRRIAAAALTGSTAAGRAVGAAAGGALKKVVLELGGSDPYLILEDADLEQAVEVCAASRLLNSGQSCIAAKRLLVMEPVREAFERRFVERLAATRSGSPLDEATDIGPLARADLRQRLHHQVEQSLEMGARLLLGGTVPEGPGFFYPPTVLSEVTPGMPAYDEELFGPVATIFPVASVGEAIRLANDTPYGLGAAVFTRDLELGLRLASEELEAGCCFVNEPVRSDPRMPFGGIKASGHGRELGQLGIRELTHVKTVVAR